MYNKYHKEKVTIIVNKHVNSDVYFLAFLTSQLFRINEIYKIRALQLQCLKYSLLVWVHFFILNSYLKKILFIFFLVVHSTSGICVQREYAHASAIHTLFLHGNNIFYASMIITWGSHVWCSRKVKKDTNVPAVLRPMCPVINKERFRASSSYRFLLLPLPYLPKMDIFSHGKNWSKNPPGCDAESTLVPIPCAAPTAFLSPLAVPPKWNPRPNHCRGRSISQR